MNRPSTARRGTRALRGAFLLLAASLATSAGAQVRPGRGGFGGSAPQAGAQDAYLFHVLSRLTFGPNEASLAEIRAIGADTFIWQQLHPGLVDDSALETRLAGEVPGGADPAYIWKHLHYEVPLRYATSRRQLQEVMVQFWDNHFDTVVPYGGNDVEQNLWSSMEKLEQDQFRANAFGRFRDLLEISAKSQAMMYFLDNYQNTVNTGNENYARELLELHSLGVDCGYTQQDVQEVARIWTGWTGRELPQRIDFTNPAVVVEGDFVFNGPRHDFTAKTALGNTFPPGGALAEGERVLDILSRHPCTARFITTKLLNAFVTDSPSPELVDRIAAVFLDTDGDIQLVLAAIFDSPEFRDPANFGGKVKTPLEFILSANRATNATMTQGDPADTNDYRYREAFYSVANLGMNLFNQPIPTGYAETAPTWISANGFLQRWQYSYRLMMYWYPALARPTSTDPMPITSRLGLRTADEVIDHFTKMLIGRTVDDTRRGLLRGVLLGAQPEFNPADGGQNSRLREMISHVLGFPEFNEQ